MPLSLSILGAGAWGTALAIRAAARHPTMLWARDAAQIAAMSAERRNQRYLPEASFPEGLQLTADFDTAVAHAEGGLLVIATPMAALRETLARLPRTARAWWLCKGFEAGTGLLGHEVAREVCPEVPVGMLSGPSFAQEVARAQPTALVAASVDEALRDAAVEAFHGEALRIYPSADPVGVEVGAAVKNVLAIATGVCDGLGLGHNARAALITRGLAEMTRLGLALGARAETFMGLSGLGDLVLTATGDLSRNRQVGLRLARGRALPDILRELGHVAEGVYSARTVVDRARRAGVDMPISAAVVELLDARLTPAQAVRLLMSRAVTEEFKPPA